MPTYAALIRRLSLKGLPAGDSGQLRRWTFPTVHAAAGLHDHDFHELFWVEEGEGLHHVNGEARPLRAGDIVLVRPEDVHGLEATRAPFVFTNFAFRSAIWRRLHARHFGRRPVLFAARAVAAREYRPSAAAFAAIREMTRALLGARADALAVEAALLPVLALLDQAGRESKGKSVPAWLLELRQRVQEPRVFQGGVAALVELAGYSGEHLARSAQKHLGKTPTQLLNDARLGFAAQQLVGTERKIPDIIADCGFENVGHFYRLFHARFGVSPARYRSEGHWPD